MFVVMILFVCLIGVFLVLREFCRLGLLISKLFIVVIVVLFFNLIFVFYGLMVFLGI